MEGYVEVADDARAVWEEYKDREGQKTSLFSLKDYQRYAHLRVALDDWAKQVVELLSTPPEHKVNDSEGIELDPL